MSEEFKDGFIIGMWGLSLILLCIWDTFLILSFVPSFGIATLVFNIIYIFIWVILLASTISFFEEVFKEGDTYAE